ncbi:hypothetical protein F4780DRAFT_19954 [Xylariomycetidae sp. FL0641]|nr:hypothetical protein F4780DRAFT_19954 [Xylariomycetidae sp. FL0641]
MTASAQRAASSRRREQSPAKPLMVVCLRAFWTDGLHVGSLGPHIKKTQQYPCWRVDGEKRRGGCGSTAVAVRVLSAPFRHLQPTVRVCVRASVLLGVAPRACPASVPLGLPLTSSRISPSAATYERTIHTERYDTQTGKRGHRQCAAVCNIAHRMAM